MSSYMTIFSSFQHYGVKVNIRYDEQLHEDRTDLHNNNLTPVLSRQVSEFRPHLEQQQIFDELDSQSLFKHIQQSPYPLSPPKKTGTFNHRKSMSKSSSEKSVEEEKLQPPSPVNIEVLDQKVSEQKSESSECVDLGEYFRNKESDEKKRQSVERSTMVNILTDRRSSEAFPRQTEILKPAQSPIRRQTLQQMSFEQVDPLRESDHESSGTPNFSEIFNNLQSTARNEGSTNHNNDNYTTEDMLSSLRPSFIPLQHDKEQISETNSSLPFTRLGSSQKVDIYIAEPSLISEKTEEYQDSQASSSSLSQLYMRNQLTYNQDVQRRMNFKKVPLSKTSTENQFKMETNFLENLNQDIQNQQENTSMEFGESTPPKANNVQQLINEINKDSRKHLQEYNQLQFEYQRLQKKFEQAQQNNEKTKEGVRRLSAIQVKQKDQLEMELRYFKKENQELKETVDKQQLRIQDYKNRLEKNEEELQTLKEQNNKMKLKIKQLKTEFEQKSQEAVMADRKDDYLQLENERLKSQLEFLLNEKNAQKQSTRKTKDSDQSERIKQLEKTIADLTLENQRLLTLSNVTTNWDKEKKSFEVQIDYLRNTNQKLLDEIDELQYKHQLSEKLRKQFKEFVAKYIDKNLGSDPSTDKLPNHFQDSMLSDFRSTSDQYHKHINTADSSGFSDNLQATQQLYGIKLTGHSKMQASQQYNMNDVFTNLINEADSDLEESVPEFNFKLTL